jgi:hypothetical protein
MLMAVFQEPRSQKVEEVHLIKKYLRVMKKMPKWEPALQAGRPNCSSLSATCNFYRAGRVKVFILPFP